ncbi:UNVERIFIED_CONTAM: hypothetical protein RMT77_008042 [Armadillidium vulgare]
MDDRNSIGLPTTSSTSIKSEMIESFIYPTVASPYFAQNCTFNNYNEASHSSSFTPDYQNFMFNSSQSEDPENISNCTSQYFKNERSELVERKPIKKKRNSSSPRKRLNRFDGEPEEEVLKKFLPDHIHHNLDILIIGINPGLFAAHKGHHYAGPGNHFWKCLFMSGLIPEPYNAYDDFRMIDFGIGFTNIVARTTRGSADLTKKEIEEGAKLLLTKLQYYKPKIAVFNGKGIYEIYSKKKDFNFGKQPETVEGTSTYIWVMPSSSARCSQLPRAIDKLPFYSALKKLRDYLKGEIPSLSEEEVVFSSLSLKNKFKESPQKVEVKEEPSG